ncbi:hypothetical protein B0T16DRAFT_337310 [Cercophora newfieldiana]|uniref:Uncharacterized protein n=1 Tax=Cercophora newfieldiana TaxID=92897 RepID=A0AA40CI64_9PEZI|nr:hypothetical protein B0T16DRAFT_337310 [Cercophora newfieldiana]
MAQQMLDCDEEVIQSEECSEVISPIACYNQFRWNQQTLTCIEGTDAEKKAKFCKCAKCIGTPMVNWVTRGNFCTAGGTTGGGAGGGAGGAPGRRPASASRRHRQM